LSTHNNCGKSLFYRVSTPFLSAGLSIKTYMHFYLHLHCNFLNILFRAKDISKRLFVLFLYKFKFFNKFKKNTLYETESHSVVLLLLHVDSSPQINEKLIGAFRNFFF